MPVRLFAGKLEQYAKEFTGYGNSCLIVTGKSSAKNGSLDDVTKILSDNGITYTVFNGIEENPSTETVDKAAEVARRENVSFIIAIGGGSPMDAAKAISLLAKNSWLKAMDLYQPMDIEGLPMVAVPTTAGTGSEATPFSVLTIHEKKIKQSIVNNIFFEKAFLDGSYMTGLPEQYTLSTAVDILSHLVEGYLTVKASFISDRIAEGGLLAFGKLLPQLVNRNFTSVVRNELLYTSSLAGMVITQSKTSLCHQLGYFLTYNNGMPHGFANAVLMAEFLKFHKDRSKVEAILRLLNVKNEDELKDILKNVTTFDVKVTHEQLVSYAKEAAANKSRLAIHPYPVTEKDILTILENSLL